MQAIIEQIARTACESVGVTLYDLELKVDRQARNLVIYLTKPEGVTIDDCARVSHLISDELDRQDPISGHYNLEVSSAGLERKLTRPEHWLGAVGEKVKITREVDGKKVTIAGILLAVEADSICMRVDKQETTLPLSVVIKARTVFEMKAPKSAAE